jgi:hypothetical protein
MTGNNLLVLWTNERIVVLTPCCLGQLGNCLLTGDTAGEKAGSDPFLTKRLGLFAIWKTKESTGQDSTRSIELKGMPVSVQILSKNKFSLTMEVNAQSTRAGAT